MLTILSAELKRRKWSTLWWIIGISLFLVLVMGVYPTVRDQAAQLNKSLQDFPTAARNLFTDTSDFLSPVGYLSSQCYYLMMPLLFSFLAIGLGSSLLAREEQNHTLELLLARPVSRSRLLLGKVGAGLTIMLLVGLITAGLAAALAGYIGFAGVTTMSVFMVTLMCLDFALIFGALALALTCLGKLGRGAAIGVATLLALGGYIISSLDQTITWLRWPARFLPFHYYHPADILRGNFTTPEAVGMLIVSVFLILAALLAFRRRDIS